jgi:tetratricopeptide (TPR) repeat protein
LYNTIGFTYFKSEKYKQAIYYYLEAIKILPDYTLGWNNLGFAYESTKEYEQAMQSYRNVLKYEEKNKMALARKGFVESKLMLK